MNPNTRILGPALALVAAVLGILAILPATSQAKTAEFGADLTGMYAPVDDPQPCFFGGSCTRVGLYYDVPTHLGDTPYAPKDGVIKKISLVALDPGDLKIQLAKSKGVSPASSEIKIVSQGPKLRFDGDGSIETFKVHIPVKKGQWLAFKSKLASTIACGSGFATEAQFQPPLQVGGPFGIASSTSDCTSLIGAEMKY